MTTQLKVVEETLVSSKKQQITANFPTFPSRVSNLGWGERQQAVCGSTLNHLLSG